MFQEFKGKELEQVRAEITKIAYGKANVSFEEWKVKWEKEIREDAIKRSREVTFGKITEHFLPFHPAFDFNPKDVRFIGSPIDMIVFEGITDELEEINIHILEVKTGKSKLSQRQKAIKKAVLEKRIFWKELNFEELENAIKIDSISATTDLFNYEINTTNQIELQGFYISKDCTDEEYESFSGYGYTFEQVQNLLNENFSLKFIDNLLLKRILDAYVHHSKTDLYFFKNQSDIEHFIETGEIKNYSDIYYNDECIDFLNENLSFLTEDIV